MKTKSTYLVIVYWIEYHLLGNLIFAIDYNFVTVTGESLQGVRSRYMLNGVNMLRIWNRERVGIVK